MSGLENLLGGDLGKTIGGLIQQVEGGTAHAVSPQDAAAHHDAVAAHLSPKDYEQAAVDAASKLTPEQRKELAEQLTHVATAQGHAQAAAKAKQDPTPDSLGQLLGALQGSGGITNLAGELLGNATVRSALVGVATSAAKRVL